MALPSSSPHSLGLDLHLGLVSSSSSSCRVGSLGVRERRRRVAVKRRLLELHVFDFSDRCLSWRASWGGPLHLQAAGNWGSAVLGSLGQGRNGTGYGIESENEKRLHSQQHTRIAASNSSSKEVGAAAESWGSKDIEKPHYDDDGNVVKLQKQSPFTDSETLSRGWGSEQDHAEAEFAERNHSSAGVSTSGVEDYFEGNNGSVRGEIIVDRPQEDPWERDGTTSDESSSLTPSSSTTVGSPTSVGPKEPVYEVIEVSHFGREVKKLVSRRQLLRTSGLRLRDLRRIDPSLWVTNSSPALLVRDQAILINLGSLRAVATTQEVLIFDEQSNGAQSFIKTLVRRLNDHHNGSVVPFEVEVIESALISRTQRLEKALMDVEPRVIRLLEVLPTCMTGDVLEDLRVSKQALVEVGSKAGALRQMLLELLEHPQDIRRMVIMGRMCSLGKDGEGVDCLAPQDKQVAEDEEEEMEMLLEFYLQRCESTHGQSLKLLSSAKEMEDSIAVNLSSRRLEVSRLELLLEVGTFCAALGAVIAGIFGMNLKSYLEERALAFWFTTAGIILGGIALFLYMFSYLRRRKIL